jgi:hypothetical protein
MNYVSTVLSALTPRRLIFAMCEHDLESGAIAKKWTTKLAT